MVTIKIKTTFGSCNFVCPDDTALALTVIQSAVVDVHAYIWHGDGGVV